MPRVLLYKLVNKGVVLNIKIKCYRRELSRRGTTADSPLPRRSSGVLRSTARGAGGVGVAGGAELGAGEAVCNGVSQASQPQTKHGHVTAKT
jgi:hypothetical protein